MEELFGLIEPFSVADVDVTELADDVAKMAPPAVVWNDSTPAWSPLPVDVDAKVVVLPTVTSAW